MWDFHWINYTGGNNGLLYIKILKYLEGEGYSHISKKIGSWAQDRSFE